MVLKIRQSEKLEAPPQQRRPTSNLSALVGVFEGEDEGTERAGGDVVDKMEFRAAPANVGDGISVNQRVIKLKDDYIGHG